MTKLLFGVMTLIAIVSLVALSGVAWLNRTATSSPTLTETTTGSLAILAPTQTPLPIATDTPTTVPRLTRTPQPTATSVQLDPATIAYVQQLMLDIEELIGAQQHVGDLLTTPLPNDPEWNRQMQAVIVQLQALHNRQIPINAPPMFAYFHLVFMETTELCSLLYLNFPPGDTPTLTDIDIARMSSLVCSDSLIETMEGMPDLPAHSIPDPRLAKIEVSTTSPTAVAQSGVTAAQDSNLRAGPGTDYAVVGSAALGQSLMPVARNEAGDWLLLDNGAWIAAFLVTNPGAIPALPIAGATTSVAAPVVPTSVPAEPTQAPTPVPPTATPQPTVASVPSCDPNYSGACIPVVSYDLNCPEVGAKDFYSVGSDPHGFDRDGDGLACES